MPSYTTSGTSSIPERFGSTYRNQNLRRSSATRYRDRSDFLRREKVDVRAVGAERLDLLLLADATSPLDDENIGTGRLERCSETVEKYIQRLEADEQ